MEYSNKLSLLLTVALFFVAGCGKKCNKPKDKKIAATTEVPLSNETEALFDDKLSELAFVDDELDFVSPADKKVVASNNVEVDREIAEQDADRANYSFKPVHFSFNKNDIRPDQKPIVNEDIELAQSAVKDGKEVVIEGHTCQIGSAAYNLALSQRRAESVRHEMVAHGVPDESIKTMGLGYERPLVFSHAPKRADLIKALSPNRRAEVLVS